MLLAVGARLIEAPRWNDERLQVEGERLLATHDAYFWVAGAEGINKIAEPMPMAVLLKALSWIFHIPPANIAFWASIFLGALVAIPTVLWGFSLNAPYAALLAGVLATLAPSYYYRTRLGFYDTDWAILFFPLLIGWLMAAWIRPRLRERKDVHHPDLWPGEHRVLPTILVLLTLLALPWHPSIGLTLITLLGIVTLLVFIIGNSETRSDTFHILLAISLVIAASWVGAVLGLLLLWWGEPLRERLRSPKYAILSGLLVIIVLIGITAFRYREYLALAIPNYLGPLFGQGGSEVADFSLVFPDLTASVRETQKVSLLRILEGMAFHSLLGVAGIVGYIWIIRKNPRVLFMLPLLLLGFSAVRSGVRFTMLAAPVVLLGLFIPIEWASQRWEMRFSNVVKGKQAVTAILLLLMIPVMIQVQWRTPVETVLSREHASALKSLGEIAGGEGMIWTWWDYGYASQHFSGLETFADGRRNTGDTLYSLGTVLGSDSLDRSAGFMHFAEQSGFKPWETWEGWGEAEFQAWLMALGAGEVHFDPSAIPQYLIVQWEGLEALPWSQYYGSWDFLSQSGQRSRVVKISMPLELDLETGSFNFDGNQVIEVVSVDWLGDATQEHYDYPENAGDPHLLLNNLTGEVMLLDERAYRSIFTQLLIAPNEVLDQIPRFHLITDGGPFVRIFQLKSVE